MMQKKESDLRKGVGGQYWCPECSSPLGIVHIGYESEIDSKGFQKITRAYFACDLCEIEYNMENPSDHIFLYPIRKIQRSDKCRSCAHDFKDSICGHCFRNPAFHDYYEKAPEEEEE